MSSNVFGLHILASINITVPRHTYILYIFVIWFEYNMDQTFLMMDLWNPKPVEGYIWVINNLLLN
jgi:hypothetical protein